MPRTYQRMPPEVRFWAKVNADGVCWEWDGRRHKLGYGQFSPRHGEPPVGAHQFAYEHLVGPVPEGLELDHLCRNRCCVCPEHLEPVTHLVNCQRSQRHYPTASTCRRGHPFTPENTGHNPNGQRYCRTCKRAAWKARYIPESRPKGICRLGHTMTLSATNNRYWCPTCNARRAKKGA